jgi:hypothetical protein
MTPQVALETYRFFAFDRTDCVLWDRCMQCMNDAEARKAATAMAVGDEAIEVWDVARFVGRIRRCDGHPH